MTAIEKLKNKSSDKRLFFNLYLGQEVVCYNGYPGTFLNEHKLDVDNPIYYLWLRPLSDITDEEQAIISLMAEKYWEDNGEITTLQLFIQQADYLRQRGFALHYKNYELSQMIEMGWVKLKTKNNA
jgi:hypothetical protein